jgi:hypothetical protein
MNKFILQTRLNIPLGTFLSFHTKNKPFRWSLLGALLQFGLIMNHLFQHIKLYQVER